MSRDMAETSVTDFFTLPKLGWVHQRLDPDMPQKWSGPDPWTGWKLTPKPFPAGARPQTLLFYNTDKLVEDFVHQNYFRRSSICLNTDRDLSR